MKVRDVMRSEVVSIKSDTAYEDVAKILHEHKLTGVPVLDKDDNLVGFISEKDLFKALFPSYRDYYHDPASCRDQETQEDEIDALRREPIEKFMITNVISIAPDVPILRAGGMMLAHGAHRLPVVDGGKLVGIVSREDIYGAILQKHLGY